MFFSKYVSLEVKNSIKNYLGVPEITEYEKYLGLPAVVGQNRRASLNFIKERVWGKIQEWKEKLLSQVGKEVLFKVVAQAIPTFAMSYFHLPVGLCKDIEMMIQKFWWGQWGDRRKVHLHGKVSSMLGELSHRSKMEDRQWDSNPDLFVQLAAWGVTRPSPITPPPLPSEMPLSRP